MLLQSLVLTLATVTTDAPRTLQWSCTPAEWAAPTSFKNDKVTTELGAQCLVRHGSQRGLPNLFRFLQGYVTRNVTVHEGPVPDSYAGLPGYRYDITERMGAKDPITVRQEVRVASDETTKLVYALFSKSVAASGFAGYLRELDTVLTIAPASEPGAYLFSLYSKVVVERPWYAPNGFFKAKVEEIARAKFLEARGSIIPSLVREL